MAKYYYTNMISALATGQISYRDAMCEILKRLCELENEKVQYQADWTETDSASPSYIQHKPSVQEFQADWNETNSTAYGYIQNKPSVQEFQADWNEQNSLAYGYIQNKPGTTQAYTDTPTLVPPTGVYGYPYVLRANGTWGNVQSNIISWDSGIATAQTTSFQQIINKFQNKADWTETDPDSPSFIQNKPSIPPAPVQSDWEETNTSSLAYIKNKPSIPSGQKQSDWAETDDSQVSFIKNKPGVTTDGTTSGTLVPPTKGNAAAAVLHADGTWDGVDSNYIYWQKGIMAGQTAYFTNALRAYGTFPRASWSRYTQCFAYLQALPAGASNTWGCQIVQEWIPGKFWHFKGWVFKNIANNSSITTPFFDYGINLDCVVEHTDLTAEQFAIAYNENRVYSVAKKIDGYQIDGNTDLFGRINLTDTEIGGVMVCNYDANATTGYKGILRFGGWKYSGSSMALTDYPLAQQGIGAFEFDIWVNPAS